MPGLLGLFGGPAGMDCWRLCCLAECQTGVRGAWEGVRGAAWSLPRIQICA